MTTPLSAPDPTAGPHPSVDEMADLAEELLAPADADALQRHLTGCADCRETVDALTEVRTLLGAAEPPAMPEDVAARIDAALAAAAAPAEPTPSAPPTPLSPAAPSALSASPKAPPTAPPSRPAAATGPGRARPRRRRALLLGSAAALLALALGGTFLSLSSSQHKDLTATADAARPAAGTAAPSAAPSAAESSTGAKTDRGAGGTAYQDDLLAAQVRQLLTGAASSGPVLPVKPSAGPGSGAGATDPSEVPGTTAVPPAEGGQGLTGGGRSTPACPAPSTAALLATDRGSYAGAPVDLLVYALPGRPDQLDVYLRAPDCGPVLQHRTVPAR
ncbi:hypothetical protein ACFP3U_22880 [Kitasatospora misakiensis]|uniref:Zinc-finger domain-containing protein n=1 Tax=Kitasatospora misakiensis TaxID=67330 RepID=A0ABW0X9H9_9ACTN